METKESIYDQIQTIQDLRREQLLSEDEFQKKYNILNEKLNEIAQREREEMELLEKRELENEVALHSKPLVDKLEALLKTGILTNEEFISKRDKVIDDQRRRALERMARDNNQIHKILVVSLVILSIILLAVVFVSLNSKQINAISDKSEIRSYATSKDKESTSYVFKYTAMSTLGLRGIETISMKFDTIKGRIEFAKNEISFYSVRGMERFVIDEHHDAPAGDMYGSHLFYTHNNKNEKYNIAVTRYVTLFL